jgi:hypothetical protein
MREERSDIKRDKRRARNKKINGNFYDTEFCGALFAVKFQIFISQDEV